MYIYIESLDRMFVCKCLFVSFFSFSLSRSCYRENGDEEDEDEDEDANYVRNRGGRQR